MFKLLTLALKGLQKLAGVGVKTATNPVVIGSAAVAGGTMLATDAVNENIIDPLQQPLIGKDGAVTGLTLVLIVGAVATLSFFALKFAK